VDVHAVYRLFGRLFRRRRMRRLARTLAPGPDTCVLDVGGTPDIWRHFEGPLPHLTFVNPLPCRESGARGGGACVRGDGTRLCFRDGAFDLVFSNSVVEHLGSLERQRRFAEEARRVGRRLWIQTPARGFPVEPHLVAPFLHWLPRAWQRRLIRPLSVWGWLARPSPERVDAFLDEVRLLSAKEMRALFPDCEIRTTRVLGLPKDYIAVRGTGARS